MCEFWDVLQRVVDIIFARPYGYRPVPSPSPISTTNSYGNPLPKTQHITLNSDKRTIIVGDVHGCLQELSELLEKCKYNDSCDLIFVGDLVNKGWYRHEFSLLCIY